MHHFQYLKTLKFELSLGFLSQYAVFNEAYNQRPIIKMVSMGTSLCIIKHTVVHKKKKKIPAPDVSFTIHTCIFHSSLGCIHT